MRSAGSVFASLVLTYAVRASIASEAFTVPILYADGYEGAPSDVHWEGDDVPCDFEYTLTCTDVASCWKLPSSSVTATHLTIIQAQNEYYAYDGPGTKIWKSCAFYGTTSAVCTTFPALTTYSLHNAAGLSFAQVMIAGGQIPATQSDDLALLFSCVTSGAWGPVATAAKPGSTLVQTTSQTTKTINPTSQKSSTPTITTQRTVTTSGLSPVDIASSQTITVLSASSTVLSNTDTPGPSDETTSKRPLNTTPTPHKPALSIPEKAGIGVGVAIGSILLIFLGAFGALVWSRRQSKNPPSDMSMTATHAHLESKGTPLSHLSYLSELEQPISRGEMPTGAEAHEAPSLPTTHESEMGRSLTRRPFGIESRHELHTP